MRRFLALLLLCPMLAACAPALDNPFLGDFACEVAFSLEDVEYCLFYEKAAEKETLEIRAPETLCGLTACRTADGVMLTHGDLSFASLAGDRLFDFAALLRPRPLQIEADGDGYRWTAADYTLATDRAGTPRGIVSGRYDLRMITFERRDTE